MDSRIARGFIKVGVGVAGVAAALVLAVGGFAAVSLHSSSKATTTITVVMTEYKFKLSKTKNIPVGTVIFKVVNKGKLPHDFKINGKKTKILFPGKSQTIKVVFKKKGSYAYLCDIPGHARLGMKGALGIATAKVTPPPTTTTTSGTPCASSTPSTVDVSEFDYGFTLSKSTIGCGTVTFNMKNTGTVTHDFVIFDTGTAGQGPVLSPGQTASITVTFTHAGKYDYECDLPHHAELGMQGSFTVTP